LKTEKDSIDVEAEKVLNAYKEIEQLVENKTKELHSIEKEYNHSKKIVDEFESKKIDIQNSIDDLNRSLREKEVDSQRWTKKKYLNCPKKKKALEMDQYDDVTKPSEEAKSSEQDAPENKNSKKSGKEEEDDDDDENEDEKEKENQQQSLDKELEENNSNQNSNPTVKKKTQRYHILYRRTIKTISGRRDKIRGSKIGSIFE